MWPARWGGSCNKEPRGRRARPMTNRIAFVLAALVVLLIVVDLAIFAGAGSLFLARKLSELIEWLAFWR